MTEPSSLPDPDYELLAGFLEEFDQAPAEGAQAVVRTWCARQPHLADEVRKLAAMRAHFPPVPPLPAPVELPDFRILGELGRGGMGVVYRARQLSLDRDVALKVRRGEMSPERRDRFLNEQRFLARLHQTHIVPIHAAGQHGPWHYFAMAYIDGVALSKVIVSTLQQEASEPGKTPSLGELAVGVLQGEQQAAGRDGATTAWPGAAANEPEARADAPPRRLVLSREYYRSVAQVVAEAAEALQHAHAAGVIHRDVKPGNLLVDRNGQCWLIDFGLARSLSECPAARPPGAAGAPAATTALTQGLVGTPEYMAPEQYRCPQQPDVRWDVWGLGVTLYELLTLRRAFAGANFATVQKRVTAEEPDPVERLANVPPDLAAVCARAMRKEPEQRYATAGALADDLRRWLRFEPTTARPARTARRVALWARRNPAWATALGLAVLLLLSLTWGGLYLAGAREKAAVERAALAEAGERDRRREALMQQVLRLGIVPHEAGWFAGAWALVREVARIRPGPDARDRGAGLLTGMDARPVKRFAFAGTSLAFDPAGRRLLMSGLPGEGARLWEDRTDTLRTLRQAGEGPVAFARDGTPLQLVARRGAEVSLLLWDLAGQREIQRIAVAEADRDWRPRLALSADASLLAAATRSASGAGLVGVWDAATGRLRHRFATPARSLAFAPDGSLLAAGDEQGRITVWELARGERVARLSANPLPIHALALGRTRLRRDGAAPDWLLAAGEHGGTVTVWDLRTQLPRAFCRGSHHAVAAVAFSPDGATLVSAARHRARLWDALTGRLLLELPAAYVLTEVAFAPDGKRLAASAIPAFGDAGRVLLWDLEEARGVQTLRGLTAQVTLVRFSPDGHLVGALSQEWQLGVWETHSGRLLHVFQTPRGITADNAAFAVDSKGRLLAFATWQSARLWDLRAGQLLRSWTLPPGLVDQLAFAGGKLLLFRAESRDGKAAPFGDSWQDNPRVCRIRNLLGPDPLKPLAERTDFGRYVFTAEAAPDGSFFVAEGYGGPQGKDRAIKAFAGLTGKVIWEVRSQRSAAGSLLRLDPTGKLLLHYRHDRMPPDLPQKYLAGLPSGRLVGTVPDDYHTLGPAARLFGFHDTSGRGFTLYREGDSTPLVTLNADVPTSSVFDSFNRAGTHVAWGNADGTVSVADIPEVQHRLAALGLGW
jgi:serine/threonine protein kinase/WD40 repeat protein